MKSRQGRVSVEEKRNGNDLDHDGRQSIDKLRIPIQYCGHILGCLLINDAVIAKGFVLWTGFVQTLPIG